jgi:outer membrane receptor for ferrienterochelin and colicins
MIPKRPAFNRSRIGFSGNSADGAYDQQIGAVAELVSESGNSGLFIFGSTRSRSPYDRNKDGFTDLGKLDNETIGVNSFFRPFDGSELDISFHRIFEDRRGGSDMEKPVHEARVAEWTKHYKWGGKIKWNQNIGSDFRYSINYAFSLLKRDSYYGGLADDSQEARLQALGYYGFSENPLHTGGAQFQYLTSGHSFTGGIQYNNDKLLDQSVSSAAYYVDEVFENLGVFFQDEFSLGRNNELNLVAGVRLDKHSALENWIISPRISLKYQIFESLKFRAGYTSGFKAPQIFDEDLHICGLEGTQRVIRNAAGLREERSSTLSAGIEFLDFVMEIPVMLGVTAFHTGLHDAYADELVSKDGSIEFWRRINSSGAYVRGLEIDFGIKPVSKLEVRAGLTIKENKYNDPTTDFNTTEFLRTPDHFGFVRVSWELENGFSFFGSMKYSGSMYVPHEIVVDYQTDPLLELVKSQSFVEFDLSVSKTIEILPKTNTIITVGVKNLTDAFQPDLDFGISKDPGYVYGPGSPRTYFVNINLNL